ncbi:pectinesterase family protein [Runella aurantiaca]|uniref:Pectinesterase n=1 Tax=Runella aurantiaca TaxID=2282308 RepID=A0A369IDD3_9BACT|nr:pectinesterase family protein [Runella aurantiaca]RDB07042.1 pectin esterase [Runella aurantiaca]
MRSYLFLSLILVNNLFAQSTHKNLITVAQDGSGDFTTVQAAFNAVPLNNTKAVLIRIKKGIYKEKLTLDSTKNHVTLMGEDAQHTVLTYDDYSGKINAEGIKLGTTTSTSTRIVANDFTAIDITFANASGPVGQAVAMLVDGDRARFINCRFLGFQDTLYPKREGARQYYKNCYIEGTVDFIFGWAIAYFQHCRIYSKLKGGYITAASTPSGQAFGYVFNQCDLDGESPEASVYLGRPWRDYAQTVFLNCNLSKVVKPEGWHNWDKPNAEKTAFYAEYQSKGAGANPEKRVAWSKQLSENDAKKYTVAQVLGGKDHWNPEAPLLTFGLTGVRDTSFNTKRAFAQIQKQFPNSAVVEAKKLASVNEVYDIAYANTGTRDLELDVFYPKAKTTKPRPTVLIIHGGGWRSGDRSQHIPLAQKLAERGFVAVTVEYRLSTEALYPAAVYDLKAAVRWLRANAKKYTIDVDKIAALGFSAGGQLAALLGSTNGLPKFEGELGNAAFSSKINAIVDLDGTLAFIHPESGEGDDSKSISAATYWFGYNKTQNPELWNEAGALQHVDKNTPPILFINSSVNRMHAGRDEMRRKMDALGRYSEVHSFPEAPHTFVLFTPWFDPMVEHIVSFLRKVL